MKNIFRAFLFVSLCLIPSALLRADTLKVETDYRMRGVLFSNLDYDKTTSTDALHFYDQRLCISIGGQFAPNIEIGSKITAIGIVGATTNYFNAPYPRTDFTPYIENAFVKITNVADTNLDFTVGKIGLIFGDGLIIDDNGVGFNALKLDGNYKLPVPFTNKIIPFKGELFLAKISESINQDTDSDLFGGVATLDLKKNLLEIGYFDQRDYSGTPYTLGANVTPVTRSIQKQFYDVRVGQKLQFASYQFELAKENGIVTKPDLTSVNIDALGWVASGKLIGEKTKLGKVEARASLAVFTGNDGTSAATDNSFTPTYTKRWDGLERAGYGELVAATPMDAFIKFPSTDYSGIDTLAVGAGFSPLYSWTFGVDYYLFSASQGPKGAPVASGFERIFGAEFSLGIELDLSAKVDLSKYVSMRVSYARYTPPTFDQLWPKVDPLDRYSWEISSKF